MVGAGRGIDGVVNGERREKSLAATYVSVIFSTAIAFLQIIVD